MRKDINQERFALLAAHQASTEFTMEYLGFIVKYFGFAMKYFLPTLLKLLLGINQAGVCRVRTKLNDFNSENCSNVLMVVFARILPLSI